jgi:sulfate transport system ATP-binding protein
MATVKRIIHLGGEIKVELLLENEHTIFANVSREQFAKMEFKIGQSVFVRPQRATLFPRAI